MHTVIVRVALLLNSLAIVLLSEGELLGAVLLATPVLAQVLVVS